MKKLKPIIITVSSLLLALSACTSLEPKPATTENATDSTAAADSATFGIPFEKYTLDNGLEVVLHQDRSDPIVAVATLMHVGSNREVPGKTGFAHFFEHMSFNDSENVPRGANRKMIQEMGGERNGGTWSDGTIYYEIVPKDALEKILWIDSDRLGYMINTVTDAALEREKEVVKNEKRQNYDNQPYGHTDTVIKQHLYPYGHPYSWTTIGSLQDLQAATLDDVKEFYEAYYGANNATLVIAGDIDIEETKVLVEKWFGEIRRGPEVPPMAPQPAGLGADKSLYFEDNFARLPKLTMVFPTVEEYHPDSYALTVLSYLLAGNKQSPLYQVIVETEKLAPNVGASQLSMELAGEFRFAVRAKAGVDLDAVLAALNTGLQQFEQNGFADDELARIKALLETNYYSGINGVQSKAFQLAAANEFGGDPGRVSEFIQRMSAVTRDDVMRVYRDYIKDKPKVSTSFVPKGSAALALDGAQLAEVYEEPIVAGAEADVSSGAVANYEKTITKIDRSEPPLGDAPLFQVPDIWTDKLSNGLKVYGIENNELPLVGFSLQFRGGHLLNAPDQSGTASLLAEWMLQGTEFRTPAEMELVIDLLGASINVQAGRETFTISGSTLARNFEPTMELLKEILLHPRWDQAEFQRLLSKRKTGLKAQEANSNAIASNAFNRLLYGDAHILGWPSNGTPETVANIDMDTLKSYYRNYLSPGAATFNVAGDISQQAVVDSLDKLLAEWQGGAVKLPGYKPVVSQSDGPSIYFVDVPGAKQSVIRVGRITIAADHPDHNNLRVANARLGGGSSARLFQLLRIEKGYTYGASSGVRSSLQPAPYGAFTSVRANVTTESVELLRQQMQQYADTFTEADAETTRTQLLKADTRAYETLEAKLGLLQRLSFFRLPHDIVEQEQAELTAMSAEDMRNTIREYIREEDMTYLIVGDAASQAKGLESLGYGPVIYLDSYGRPVAK